MSERTIDTGGGLYNQGEMDSGGGDIVGRDEIVYGDKVTHVYQNVQPSPAGPGQLAAQRRLAALPLDTIPGPAPLPSGSRMPFARNPLFVGREQDLLRLAKTLKGGQTTAIGQVTAATGLGGIGKTQLASEFVHRYGQYFAGGVFWLSFFDPAGVSAEVALCGGGGHLDLAPDFAGLPLDDQVRLVLSAWCGPLPRLLVFDNCEDETLLAKWRPAAGGCRVLVTSRRQRWSKVSGVQALPLGVLSRAESIELLRKFRPDLAAENPGLAEIAAELGDLPLALHLAGSYLESYADDPTFGSPADFLAELRGARLLQHPALQGKDVTPTPTNHDLHVGRTFAMSYGRLEADDPTDRAAAALLHRAAFFAPGEPVPRELLLATLHLDAGDREGAREAARGLERLAKLGLVEQEKEGAVRLHRLVADFAQSVMVDAEAQDAVERAVINEAYRLNMAGYPAPLLAWQVHLRAVTETARKREDDQAATLCANLGYHLKMIGDYAAARPLYERALAIYEKVLGPDHPYTATNLNNLASLLQDQGDLAAARPLFERALVIYEKVLGPDHPNTASSLNNLAGLLQAQGDLAAARPLYERALVIYEKVLGPGHPYTASSLNNLARLLQDQGDLAAARPLSERALAIREKVLGPDHPDTASSLNNLALLLQAQGDLAAARPLSERALAIVEKVLGPDHPDTAQSLNNLALLLQAQGDLAAARPLLERALAIYEKVLGPDHPYTATSLNNLARLLQAQGDLAAARPLFERALAIREKVLGPDHPDTAQSLNNLALLLKAQGDLAAARPLYERALAIYEKVLGPDHPNSRIVRGNLARLKDALK